MAKRGDAELASAMRRLLATEPLSDLTWDRHANTYLFTVSATTTVTEEEAHAIEEAQS